MTAFRRFNRVAVQSRLLAAKRYGLPGRSICVERSAIIYSRFDGYAEGHLQGQRFVASSSIHGNHMAQSTVGWHDEHLRDTITQQSETQAAPSSSLSALPAGGLAGMLRDERERVARSKNETLSKASKFISSSSDTRGAWQARDVTTAAALQESDLSDGEDTYFPAGLDRTGPGLSEQLDDRIERENLSLVPLSSLFELEMNKEEQRYDEARDYEIGSLRERLRFAPAMSTEDAGLLNRQIQLESEAKTEAVEELKKVREQVIKQLKRGAELGVGQHLLLSWFEPLVEAIEKQYDISAHMSPMKDLSDFRTYLVPPLRLKLIKPEELAVIAMHETLNLAMTEMAGVKYTNAAISIGRTVEAEIQSKRSRRGRAKMARRLTERDVQMYNTKARRLAEEKGEATWSKEALVKVGGVLIQLLYNTAKVPEKDAEGNIIGYVSAFEHSYQVHRSKKTGVLRLHEKVFNMLMDETAVSVGAVPRYLPMLVPPKPWISPTEGGYLTLQSLIMRLRGSRQQLDALSNAEMEPIYDSLNKLSVIPWAINQDIYPWVMEVWNNGGGLADIPSHEDLPIPPPPADMESDEDAARSWKKQRQRVVQKNRERYSERCDCKLKLMIATRFKDEEKFYFPYNMDFRGRAYAMSPNLNHLGSDMCRGLLRFANKKPLGKKGVRWLKIHIANMFGVDKCSFDDRVKFTEGKMDDIRDSATNPLKGRQYWLEADSPWQALAACIELVKAIDSGAPEEFMSGLPIQQDGSCNGLQHYAALGRDLLGAKQVNLTPSDKPQDVYTGVADRLIACAEQDAAADDDTLDEAGKKKKHLAKILLGNITRRVVKQTVMTSVYGVTFIGARKQIQSKLQERLISSGELVTPEKENEIYEVACYAARTTMECMGSLFTGARDIMAWLGEVARIIAMENQPVSWVTPLGLPVIQPYRQKSAYQVKTLMQSVILADHDDLLPVSAARQRSAFPPNYVHSLDSTHMMLTALACHDEKIDFASVHDSYWTHAADVDIMNRILREQFIQLHSQPLLEDLKESLEARFPGSKFPDIPEKGSLDLSLIRDSPYFFN